MTRRLVCTVGAVFVLTASATAQTGSIAGTVVDAMTRGRIDSAPGILTPMRSPVPAARYRGFSILATQTVAPRSAEDSILALEQGPVRGYDGIDPCKVRGCEIPGRHSPNSMRESTKNSPALA